MQRSLSLTLNQYVWLSTIPACIVAGGALIIDPHPSAPTTWLWLVYPLLFALGWVGEEYRVKLRVSSYTLTASIHLPFILLLTPLESLVLAAATMICTQTRRKRPITRVVYNAVMRVIPVGIPAIGLALWYRHDPRFPSHSTFLSSDLLHSASMAAQPLFGLEIAGGCALAAVLYFVLDSALIATVLAVQTGVSPLRAWRTNLQSVALPEIAKSVLGIVAALLYVVNPIFVVFIVLPVLVAHVATDIINRLENETIEAITTLADIVDLRDPYTARHCERVAATSRRLAQRLGLSREEVEEVTLAARVHDVGKMGIANEILLKAGPLTHEETAEMQRHSQLGADVLQKYRNFRRSVPLVLHHHERYDGRGYPTGIGGADIPLGAMIIAHADTFDAMTSDRPYRKGMRAEVALQRVSEASGTQFDPAIAGVFVSMLREDLEAQGQTMAAIGGSLAEPATNIPYHGGSENVLPLRRKENSGR